MKSVSYSHSRRVAEKCRLISKELYGFDTDEADRMYFLGLLHDIGHERCGCESVHPIKAAAILREMFGSGADTVYARAIETHGSYCTVTNEIEEILNYADMTTDIDGNDQSLDKALLSMQGHTDSGTLQNAECLVLKLRGLERKVNEAFPELTQLKVMYGV